MPNGKIHSGCTDHFAFGYVFVLVSRIQKSGTGDNNWDISVMSGPVKVDQLQFSIFEFPIIHSVCPPNFA